jgi:hypothetical protein
MRLKSIRELETILAEGTRWIRDWPPSLKGLRGSLPQYVRILTEQVEEAKALVDAMASPVLDDLPFFDESLHVICQLQLDVNAPPPVKLWKGPEDVPEELCRLVNYPEWDPHSRPTGRVRRWTAVVIYTLYHAWDLGYEACRAVNDRINYLESLLVQGYNTLEANVMWPPQTPNDPITSTLTDLIEIMEGALGILPEPFAGGGDPTHIPLSQEERVSRPPSRAASPAARPAIATVQPPLFLIKRDACDRIREAAWKALEGNHDAPVPEALGDLSPNNIDLDDPRVQALLQGPEDMPAEE